MDRVEKLLVAGTAVRDGEWKAADIEFLNKHSFMTAKPVVYLVNIGRDEYITKKNKLMNNYIEKED